MAPGAGKFNPCAKALDGITDVKIKQNNTPADTGLNKKLLLIDDDRILLHFLINVI
jgi:hypothetical protein